MLANMTRVNNEAPKDKLTCAWQQCKLTFCEGDGGMGAGNKMLSHPGEGCLLTCENCF